MSYGLKYTMNVASKNELASLVYTAYIYEKDYVGSSYEFDPADRPMTCQILSGSDNQFDGIIGTTFTLLADITDFTHDLPDFTTTDDRKYHVKIYANTTTYLVWQGFILMEQVTLPFITGRTFLQMVCTDGFAMLKNIPYVPSHGDINQSEDLSTVITNCLNLLDLPDGYNVNYACYIYATGQVTTASVFKQTYYMPRNWLSNVPTKGATGTDYISPYMSAYDVLNTIATSFGCQMYQSNGEYWVGNVNQRAEDSIIYFTTTNANGAETKSVRHKQREILPYVDASTTPYYFQDAVQAKIIRKGYEHILVNCPAKYAPQMMWNGTMVDLTAGFPDGFQVIGGGSVTLSSLGPFGPYNAINLAPTSSSPPGNTAGALATSSAKGYEGDILSISFWIDGQVPPDPVTPKCKFQVYLHNGAGPGNEYWLNNDKQWQNTSTYIDIIGTTSGNYESISITAPPFPINGDVVIAWVTENATTLTCTFGNVVLTYSNLYDYRQVKNSSTSKTYEKTVELKMGGPSTQFNYSQVGSLLDSTGAVLSGWHRLSVVESYDDLTRLIAQQYYNVQNKGQINFNLTVRGLFDDRDVTGPVTYRPHIIGIADVMTIQDTTTNSLSVNGFYYLIGAGEFDYVEDTFNGTMLVSSDTDISITLTDREILKT